MVAAKRNILSENAETNNVKAAKSYILTNDNTIKRFILFCNETGKSEDYKKNGIKKRVYDVIEMARNQIPNVRLGAYKFLTGVCKYFAEEPDFDRRDLNTILGIVTRPEYIDKYPRDFGCTFSELYQKLSGVIEQEMIEKKKQLASKNFEQKNEYQVVKINSFEQAQQYKEYAAWCICYSPYPYMLYAVQGGNHDTPNQFYFLLRNDYKNVEKEKGPNFPKDDYGMSMIAVLVSPQGDLVSAFTRWNDPRNGDAGRVFTEEELSELVGRNFYEVFKPYKNNVEITESQIKRIIKECVIRYLNKKA